MLKKTLTLIPPDTISQWRAGLISDQQALRELTHELGETVAKLTPLQDQTKQLRAEIEEIVYKMGGQAEAEGVRWRVQDSYSYDKYDARQLNSLIAELAATHPDIAGRFAECKKRVDVAASLRQEKRQQPASEPPF
jgi:chromosome segregation ATPase